MRLKRDSDISRAMAEDFDLDRVINDPAYRRQVISLLNKMAANAQQGADDPAADSVAPPPLDPSSPDRAVTR